MSNRPVSSTSFYKAFMSYCMCYKMYYIKCVNVKNSKIVQMAQIPYLTIFQFFCMKQLNFEMLSFEYKLPAVLIQSKLLRKKITFS